MTTRFSNHSLDLYLSKSLGPWRLGLGDWGLGNMLELVGIDFNRLERLE